MARKFEIQKKNLKRIENQITSSLKVINKRIDANYGVIGGLTETQVKQIGMSLISIDKRLKKIKGEL